MPSPEKLARQMKEMNDNELRNIVSDAFKGLETKEGREKVARTIAKMVDTAPKGQKWFFATLAAKESTAYLGELIRKEYDKK